MKPTPPEGGSRSGAVSRPGGVVVEQRIDIAAPAEVVWELVFDLQGWSEWNPLYCKASGAFRVGETIDMVVTIPGTRPGPVRAKVLAVVPGKLVQYGVTVLGGVLRGTRCIEIQPTGAEACVVVNTEFMGGLLGPLAARAAAERVRIGLEVMNDALRQVAEARWQARSGHAGGAPDLSRLSSQSRA